MRLYELKGKGTHPPHEKEAFPERLVFLYLIITSKCMLFAGSCPKEAFHSPESAKRVLKAFLGVPQEKS